MIRETVQKTFVEVDGKQVPAKIYRQWRNNVRFAIGKTGAILRMPTMLSKSQQNKQIAAFEDWVRQQFSKRDALNERFFGKGYNDGDVLQVGNRSYPLNIDFLEKKSHSARMRDGVIYLKLAKKDTEANLQKAIKHLLSRLVAQDFLPEITERVLELNKKYFQKPIRSVNLKYNLSNWGSCSAKSNINLSTRLLFAPDSVIDYVIIHELAHLIEMNHSPRFWAIVKKAMPDYQQKEKWLKQNGKYCDF